MTEQQRGKIATFFLESKRIFAISRKPTRKEYNLTVKICLVGLVITGGLSYIVQIISSAISNK